MDLQTLRNSFELQEEVHVQFRGYGGAAPKIKMGVIVGKEAAFASVKFERNVQKIPYTRLQRCRPAADIPTPEEKQKKKATRASLRVVPAAFEALQAPEQEPPPQPSLLPEPPPSFLAKHVVTASNTQISPVVPEAIELPAAPETEPVPSDVSAWLDIGRTLLPTLRATETRLRAEATALAEHAEKLMNDSDAKLKEADEIARYLDMVSGKAAAAE